MLHSVTLLLNRAVLRLKCHISGFHGSENSSRFPWFSKKIRNLIHFSLRVKKICEIHMKSCYRESLSYYTPK